MGSGRLVVDFERQADGAVVLRLSGRLERATAPLLEGVLYALRAAGTPVTVDLTGVEQIDGHGLDILLRADLDVVGVSESLRRRAPKGDEPEPRPTDE